MNNYIYTLWYSNLDWKMFSLHSEYLGALCWPPTTWQELYSSSPDEPSFRRRALLESFWKVLPGRPRSFKTFCNLTDHGMVLLFPLLLIYVVFESIFPITHRSSWIIQDLFWGSVRKATKTEMLLESLKLGSNSQKPGIHLAPFSVLKADLRLRRRCWWLRLLRAFSNANGSEKSIKTVQSPDTNQLHWHESFRL